MFYITFNYCHSLLMLLEIRVDGAAAKNFTIHYVLSYVNIENKNIIPVSFFRVVITQQQ